LVGFLQRSAVQPILLQILPQSCSGHAEVEGTLDEGEQVLAMRLGMREKKLGDGTGMAW
jgi:hypothetical protein